MCTVPEQPDAAEDCTEAAVAKPQPASASLGETAVRERIVEAAVDLFCLQGIRAVSTEKIIARAAITKVTFYRHFPSRDDLVVAYLEHRAAWERGAVEAARWISGSDVPEVLRLFSERIAVISARGFRGCPFANAATEYADAEHPVRRVVKAHREWLKAALEEMLAQIGVTDVSAAADQLMMLRDGAMVAGYLNAPDTVASTLHNAGRAIVEAHS